MSISYDRGQIEDFGRWQEFAPGMWAWLLHKFTGWVLAGYLLIHIAVLSTFIYADPAAAPDDLYTRTLQGLESLLIVRIGELGLVAAAAYHTLNGIRLMLMDIGIGYNYQREGFYLSLWLTAIAVIASVPIALGGI